VQKIARTKSQQIFYCALAVETLHHKTANVYLGLIERAENGAPPQGLCQLDRPLKWPVGSPEAGGGLFPCVDRQTASFDTH
jgi:hypothetical protein